MNEGIAASIRVSDVEWQRSGEPAVEVVLSREPYPRDGEEPFQPLRFPDRCRLRLVGPLPRLLRRGTLILRLALRPGFYHLPLTSGPPCQVEIPTDCVLEGRVEASRASGQPLVQTLDLRFSRPVVIHNLLSTFNEVHHLVVDAALAPLRRLLVSRLGGRVPSWVMQLGGAALKGADQGADILLERISARPLLDDPPMLPLAFSGRVRWMDQVETTFDRLVLPRAILPRPHAALEALLSPDPLASASVIHDLDDPLGLLTVLRGTLASAEVELSVSLEPPRLRAIHRTIDGAEMQASLLGAAPIVFTANLTLDLDEDRFQLRNSHLTIHPAGDHRHAVNVKLAGDGRLDLRPGLDAARRVGLRLGLELDREASWDEILVELLLHEVLAPGQVEARLRLAELVLDGGAFLELEEGEISLCPSRPWTLSAELSTPEAIRLRDARGEMQVRLEAQAQTSLEAAGPRSWRIGGEIQARLRGRLLHRFLELPELDIHQGLLDGTLDLDLSLQPRARLLRPPSGLPVLDLADSTLSVTAHTVELRLEDRRLTLPGGTRLHGHLLHGLLGTAGPERLAGNLRWDLCGERCLLHFKERTVSLLTPDLRTGELTMLLSNTGRIRFEGDSGGLYGVRYFNALLNPASDPEQLWDLLRSDDALARVISAIDVFNPRVAEAIRDLRALVLGTQTILKRENIVEPADLVPRQAMARLLSLLLRGDDSLRERFASIIQRVTSGGGLDLRETRSIMQAELGEFDIDYELGAVLNWLDLVLSPTEALPVPPLLHDPPLGEDPRFEDARRGLPSAADIYQIAKSKHLSAEWTRRLDEVAPLLTRKQLDHLIAGAAPEWDRGLLTRLRHVRAIKLRVEAVREQYGGPEHGLQPALLAGWLGEAVGPLPGINCPALPGPGDWPPACALGPEEVAVLLQAGQSSGREARRAQINSRLLLELLRRNPPSFTQAVLVEVGHQSPRALSGFLYAFLDQDQDHLTAPLDLPALLSEKLELEVPRLKDYLAGGRRAAESYYEALCRVADLIIDNARPCLARKHHLQVLRHPLAPAIRLQPSEQRLEERALAAIARADELGRTCRFDGERGGPRSRSREAYRRAFEACARLLSVEPRAFQLPWFKAFWLRNEEALTVLSVVRGYQENLDNDRRWLHIRCGRDQFKDEQDLLGTVVTTLYARPEHRAILLGDPLVRLGLDPPPDRHDFTIITAMGVITDGLDGKELEDAFRRLEERRGVRLIRTATATARSLEYNADRIIEAIAACKTPYGLLGYSQGCANILRTESLLLGGTPEQRRLLDGLVSRKLLFSAANGSAHGTAGMLKFERALVLGEKYLKHYQAVLSWEAITAMLRVAKATLDARAFIHVLGGVYSLTFERAVELHRDEQFLDHVPTSTTIAITREDELPETLEFLYYMLREQTGSSDQDTQVLIEDAVGHSTRVTNRNTVVLERCDMGCFPQSTHHWAPLTQEIKFVETPRDLSLGIYQSPKDRLIWPWVEVNARFGRLHPP